jgi:electron transport complex protein RnfA
MGIYLPLITTNCAVLGVAELVIDEAQMIGLLGISSMNMGVAVLYGLFAGLGFTLAIVIMSGLREKINRLPINKHLKGFPIAMIAACFIAMAFFVFAI